MTGRSSSWVVVWVFGLLMDVTWVRYSTIVRVAVASLVAGLVMRVFLAALIDVDGL